MSLWLIIEDLRLPAWGAAVFPGDRETDYEAVMVFARLLASGEEARGLRHALSRGLSGVLHAPERRIPFRLSPLARIREERIWVKGIPRTRVTLYLPAMGGWHFWVGPTGFYEFIESATPFPTPAPDRRAPERAVGEALRAIPGLRWRDPLPPPLAALRGETEETIRDGIRDLEAPGLPGEWAALAIRAEALIALLPALRA